MVCLAAALQLLFLSHLQLQLPICAAAPLDDIQPTTKALPVITSEDMGGANNLASFASEPELVHSEHTSGQQLGQRAGSPPKKPCIDLPPVPNFSKAFCQDVHAQLARDCCPGMLSAFFLDRLTVLVFSLCCLRV
jgi:hypothetical protein